MTRTIISAAVAAMFLAISSHYAAHAAARVQDADPRATAVLNRQTADAAQTTGKSLETAAPGQRKSAEAKSARAKTLRRAYAIRAHMAKQKAQLAKARKPALKGKKQLAKTKKPSVKAKKKTAA